MSIAAALDKAVKAVCPIDGVSIGAPGDKATWRIDFKEAATTAERAAAQAVLAAFDPAAVPAPVARDPLAELDALAAKMTAAEAEIEKLKAPK